MDDKATKPVMSNDAMREAFHAAVRNGQILGIDFYPGFLAQDANGEYEYATADVAWKNWKVAALAASAQSEAKPVYLVENGNKTFDIVDEYWYNDWPCKKRILYDAPVQSGEALAFIRECAGLSGGMVSGNRLSIMANNVLALFSAQPSDAPSAAPAQLPPCTLGCERKCMATFHNNAPECDARAPAGDGGDAAQPDFARTSWEPNCLRRSLEEVETLSNNEDRFIPSESESLMCVVDALRQLLAARHAPTGVDAPAGPLADKLQAITEDFQSLLSYATGDRLTSPGWAIATIKAAVDENVNALISANKDTPAPPILTDKEVEAIVKRFGARWNGDAWVIEDADMHPFARALLYRYTNAPVAATTGADTEIEQAIKRAPEAVVNPSTDWCDQYAEWRDSATALLTKRGGAS